MDPFINGFNWEQHINDELFREITKGINKEAEMISWSKSDVNTSGGYLTSIMSSNRNTGRILGILAFNLTYRIPGTKDTKNKKIVLKSKLTGSEMNDFAVNYTPDEETRKDWSKYVQYYGHANTHTLEIKSVSILSTDTEIRQVLPDIYWSSIDEERNVFVFAMEYFDPEIFINIGKIPGEYEWKDDEIKTVLNGMAVMHASTYYDQGKASGIPEDLRAYLVERPGMYSNEHIRICRVLIECAKKLCPNIWSNDCFEAILNLVKNLEQIFSYANSAQKCLIHYDFSPRNLCLRKNPQPTGKKHELVLYDWEMTSYGPPHIDLATFLAESLPPCSNLWEHYALVYRSYLNAELERTGCNKRLKLKEEDAFLKCFQACLAERVVHYMGGIIAYVITGGAPLHWAKDITESCVGYLKETSYSDELLN